MKIILAGVTGFIGKPLVEQLLKSGHNLYILTRDPARLPWSASERRHALQWDAERQGSWAKAVDGADAVINMAGEPIAEKRWVPAQKEKLLRSRINATRAIAGAIHAAKIKPKVLINASAVGYYGPVESGDVTEAAACGQGFLAGLCEAWERETLGLEAVGVRVVLLRIGIVLEKGGGAFAKMELPFKMFAGGPLGSGKQWFPWIHRDDIVGLIQYALENNAVSGPVNAAAPNPVTMAEFCAALGREMGRPSWAPVPAFVLKLLLGEMSEMLLTGQKAVPQKALAMGYVFKYPKVEEALKDIVSLS